MGNASNKVSKDVIVAKSTSLFNSQDVKVVKDILGKGHSEYTARRILEDAEKRQLQKVKHEEDSKNWIHRDWRVQAGLKIEEVRQEAKEQDAKEQEAKEQDAKEQEAKEQKLFIPSLPKKAVETSSQILAVESISPTEEASAVQSSQVVKPTTKELVQTEALETQVFQPPTEEASETAADAEPNVEVCVFEGENASAVLYITQPTASIFKGSSKYGNNSQAGSYVVSEEALSEDYEMDGGGFMRIANEDD